MTGKRLAFCAYRQRTSTISFVLLAGAWLCAAPASADQPLGADLPAYAAPETEADEPMGADAAGVEPEGDLSLRGALAAALLRNPDLAAFSWEVRVREARALQAGLLPNPELSVEVENIAGSGAFGGADQAETTLALGQLIELGGKRAKRRRVAELETSLAGWDYEMQRIDVFADVARAYADVLAAQQEIALSEELFALAEASLSAANRQIRAGARSSLDRSRAEVIIASQRIEVARAKSALDTARLRLAALWGSREARFERALGDLHTLSPPPAEGEVLARVDESPALERWAEEIARHEAVVALEKARGVPDFTALAGVRRLEESDDTALLFGVSVPFPVFDRNQGERIAARRELTKARHLRRAARVRVETALRTSLAELSASYAEVHSLHGDALPQAEAAHRGMQEGYQRGLMRYGDVLDAQRTLFALRQRELDALRRYHGAVAELERLTGAPLETRAAPIQEGTHE